MPAIIKECIICLQSFTTERNAKFCSRKCIERNNTLNLNPYASVRRTAADYQRVCECCGKSYINKSLRYGNKYCSRQCSNHINLHVAKVLNDKVIVGKKCTVYFKECEQCGNSYVARTSASRICSSIKCIKAVNNIASYNGSVSRKIVKEHKCKECGNLFKNEYGIKKSLFCSVKCQKGYTGRIHGAKRRNLIRCVTVENVDPIKVFDRDKWKCCLCGIKTPRSKRGKYDNNAPELDHIVSLAEGGDHSYKNTQCLCRKCNSDKGASTKGQFLLFG